MSIDNPLLGISRYVSVAEPPEERECWSYSCVLGTPAPVHTRRRNDFDLRCEGNDPESRNVSDR